MRYNKLLIILSLILFKNIVLVRNQLRTNADIYCEDVCVDGRNCVTDEWLLCKWKQLLNPSIICCFKRQTGTKTEATFGQSSAVSLQKYCRNRRRHYLVRRDLFSFIRGLTYSSVNRVMISDNFPWFVELLAFEQHLCGGSVIGDNIVVTAAHCFVPFFDSSVYSIRMGFNASNEGKIIYVSRIIIHELYFPSESYHDIALIITKTAIHINARVDIVCLPSPDMRMAQMIGRSGTAIGFSHELYNKVISKPTEVRMVAREECTQLYSNGDKHNIPVGIQHCMICARAVGPHDVIQGDSGGPLIIVNDGVQYIMGIISFGRNSRSANFPGVYTNLVYYRKWILNKLSKY